MITVYHLRRSRSERILWLLEELGLDYEIVAFDRDARSRAPEAMRGIHPLGKSPILGDGELVLAESGAIVDYLVTRYGRGRLAPGHDDPDWPRYVFWLHYSEGSLMPWLVTDLLVNSGVVPDVDPGPLGSMLAEEIARNVQWIDGELADRDFAAGDAFSAADVMLTFALQMARGRGRLEGTRHLVPYLDRMTARDAYRRAEQKANPNPGSAS